MRSTLSWSAVAKWLFWQRRGLRLLLRPADTGLHSYALRACAPDRVVVTGDCSELEELDLALLGVGSVCREESMLTISTTDPAALSRVLQKVADRQCQTDIQKSGRILTAAVEKMQSWGASLGSTGSATKQFCNSCREGYLVYIPEGQVGGGGRFLW
jgi:hypothetical protein